MHPSAAEFARVTQGRLIAAAASPTTADGSEDETVTARYYAALVAGGANGLAVAVHTGRGPHLRPGSRLRQIRRAVEVTDLVVTGTLPGSHPDDEERWAAAAADAGADALLLCMRPGESGADALARCDALWRSSGLPLIAFDLYSAPLDGGDLQSILDHPAVAAFKPARLDDAVAAQRGIKDARERRRTVLTGEDRMFGPSLLWGAQGALIGLAAASVSLPAAVIRLFEDGDLRRFAAASRLLDDFAGVAFAHPVDGYVQRMMWVAADEGLIPEEYAIDTRRPDGLDARERERVVNAAREARARLASV